MKFEEFPKIPRLSREIVITEKIDGACSLVSIAPDDGDHTDLVAHINLDGTPLLLRAGSRTQWITPANDSYGFAAWVLEHAPDLVMGLGIGQHSGEWWGSGVRRNYGLSKGEKRFSLFNVGRWMSIEELEQGLDPEYAVRKRKLAPVCCHTVPILYRGPFSSTAIDAHVDELREYGSRAVPGYQFPEGVVIWHEAAQQLFKKTCFNDNKPKGAQ